MKGLKRILRNYRRRELFNSKLKKAAVLIPLFEKNGQLHILFTKRTEKVDVHKGQFSFPGGRTDESDVSPEQTALREVEEEIGIHPANIQILGCLDDLETITNYLVTPLVGLIKGEKDYKINTAEIERTLEVPLKFFLDENNWREETYNHKGRTHKGKYCLYKNDKIWGVTGRILRGFVKLLQT